MHQKFGVGLDGEKWKALPNKEHLLVSCRHLCYALS